MTLPGAYLIANFVFFWRIFPNAVCLNCAYHHPDLSGDEYRHRYQDRFLKALSRWYKVWILVGWAWPTAGMITVHLLTKRAVALISLILFPVISFGVFLPVLRLRVCPRCKANEPGICPFVSRRQMQKT